MKEYQVEVTQVVKVKIDETKFTEDFMAEFRAGMYPFEDVEDHIKHLAQLGAREQIGSFEPFVEGYGPIAGMGIEVEIVSQVEDIIE